MRTFILAVAFFLIIVNCCGAQVPLRAGGNPKDGLIVSEVTATTITLGTNAKTGQTYLVHPDLRSADVTLYGYYSARLSDVRVGMKVNVMTFADKDCWGIAIPK